MLILRRYLVKVIFWLTNLRLTVLSFPFTERKEVETRICMVAERSHKKDGQICAAISKKKRKKIIFLQNKRNYFKTLNKIFKKT